MASVEPEDSIFGLVARSALLPLRSSCLAEQRFVTLLLAPLTTPARRLSFVRVFVLGARTSRGLSILESLSPTPDVTAVKQYTCLKMFSHNSSNTPMLVVYV